MDKSIKNHWLFGYFLPFVSKRLETLQFISNSGDVTRFRLLMGVNYMVSDPNLISQVLLDPEGIYIKNRGFWNRFTDIFGQGLVVSEGHTWKMHRKLMAPAFQSRTVQSYFSIMISEIDSYIDRWGEQKTVDVHSSIMDCTLNILNSCLFNVEFGDVKHQIIDSIKTIEAQFALRVVRPFGFQSSFPSRINKEYWAALNKIDSIIYCFIKRVREKNDNKFLLDKLVNVRDENANSLSDKDIRDELLTMILAGHDTTSITVSWALYLLTQHQEYINLLRQEWSALNSECVEFNEITKLPITRGVIRETLRMYPPAYIIGREPTVDTTIGEVKVPKSMAVVISPYALGRDERFYPDAGTFNPLRWNDDFERNLPRFAFIPFGGGKRTCIGEQFAIAETAIILWRILSRFNIEYLGDDPLKAAPVMTLTPADFKIKVSKV